MITTDDGKHYENEYDLSVGIPIHEANSQPLAPTWKDQVPKWQLPPQPKPVDQKLSDETPDSVNAGQKFAMEDKPNQFEQRIGGRVRGGEGGASGSKPIPEAEIKIVEKNLPTGEMTLGNKTISQSGYINTHPLEVGGKQVGEIKIVEKNLSTGEKVLFVPWMEGGLQYKHLGGVQATPAQRIQAGLEFRKALQKEYPEAIGVYGERVSGAKAAGKGDSFQAIPLKDEYSSKDIRSLIRPAR